MSSMLSHSRSNANEGRKRKSSSKGRKILAGLQPQPIQTIYNWAMVGEDQEVKINNLKYIGSYNWLKGSPPTIIVPGSPPEWIDRQVPYTVPIDRGITFCDENGSRLPLAPLLPLMKAVDKVAEYEQESAFSWPSIDFVTDRNGLRKLLKWVDGGTGSEFRIDMQLGGERTVLFNRWEKSPKTKAWGYSFGHNFEKASTKPAAGCEDSNSHHRIVTYDLNGLKLVVRFEVDACLPRSLTKIEKSKSSKIGGLMSQQSGGSMPPATSSPPVKAPAPRGEPILFVVERGSAKVSQLDLVELKTSKQAKQTDRWKDKYMQLFVSQTPHLFLARHSHGCFRSCTKMILGEDLGGKVKKDKIQSSLKKLRRVLGTIQEIVIQSGPKGRLTLVCQKGQLGVFERADGWSCLPDDVMSRFRIPE